jgi:hypothetical protein
MSIFSSSEKYTFEEQAVLIAQMPKQIRIRIRFLVVIISVSVTKVLKKM